MTDFGAEITQQGLNVTDASDDQKVLDTRWKTLDIFDEPNFSQTVTFPVSGGATRSYITIYSHEQGFLPAFDYVVNNFTMSDPSANQDIQLYTDSQNIYLIPQITSSLSSVTVEIDITLRVLTLPITEEYQAPVVQGVPLNVNSSSGEGVEFLKPSSAGIDISTANPEQLDFSTRLRPLNILQHGTTTITSTTIVINYVYNNPPLYSLAIYQPDGFTFPGGKIAGPLIGALSFAGGKGTVTSTQITVSGTQASLAGSFAYILYKDPLNIPS